jgi:hypothetical protein
VQFRFTGLMKAPEAAGVSGTPEPKPLSLGIATRKGKLSPATEKFCQCGREAFGALR